MRRPLKVVGEITEPQWGDDTIELGPRATALRVLAREAVRLSGQKDLSKALAICDLVVHRFGEDHDLGTQEQVARLLLAKSLWLAKAGRLDEAISTSDEIASRIREDAAPELQAVVAQALNHKSSWLHKIGRGVDAIVVCTDIVRRLETYSPKPRVFYEALTHSAMWISEFGKTDEALEFYAKNRFFNQDTPRGVAELFGTRPVWIEPDEYPTYTSPYTRIELEPPPLEGGTMQDEFENRDDAKRTESFDQALAEIGLVKAAEMIFRRASPEERVRMADMALPEHRNIFQAIAAATEEFTRRRADFSKDPLPKLSAKQIAEIKKRSQDRPWTKRKENDARNPFEWVRDNYKKWVGKGLLQSHLSADVVLYRSFAKRVSRDGLPDWLDVPSEADAAMRLIADPAEQLRMLIARHLYAAQAKLVRALKL